MVRRKSAWFVLLLVVALVAAACGDDSGDDSSSDTTGSGGSGSATVAGVDLASLSGEINGSGASYPDACYQAAIADWQGSYDLSVTYNSIGSGSGKEEFGNNLNDFAGSDSLVDEGDGPEAGTFYYVPSTASSITASYNLPDVQELKLDADTLAKIFMREITTWDDSAITALNSGVTLPSTDITVAVRSDGSGTTSNFTAYLEKAAPDVWTLGSDDVVEWPSDTQGGQQNTGVAQIVQQTEGAIGYVDLGDAMVLGLQTAAIQNKDGNFVEPSVDGATAALAGAELSDDLTYDPLDASGADAYPITAPTYILVHKSYDDSATRDNVVGFVGWLVSEGVANSCGDVGFAPTPDDFQQKSLAELEQVSS